MRNYILESYPKASSKFRQKVISMPTNQVVAIYKSILERKNKKEVPKKEEYHQIDIFEYMLYKNEMEGGSGTHSDIERVY